MLFWAGMTDWLQALIMRETESLRIKEFCGSSLRTMADRGTLLSDMGFQYAFGLRPVSTVNATLQIPLVRFFFRLLAIYAQTDFALAPLFVEICRDSQSGNFSRCMFLSLFEMPLRAIVFHHQNLTIHLWTRNGSATYNETVLYRRHHWANYYYEPDLLALQMGLWAAAEIEKEKNKGENENKRLVSELIKTICDRAEVGTSLKVQPHETATVETTNRDLSLLAVLLTLGCLTDFSLSPLLTSVANLSSCQKLVHYHLETIVLNRFLLPALTSNSSIPVSEIQEISSSATGKCQILKILKNWTGSETATSARPPTGRVRSEGALSTTNRATDVQRTEESPGSILSSCESGIPITSDRRTRSILEKDGWARFNVFFPYSSWTEYLAADEGFTKWVEGSPENAEKWWLSKCCWPPFESQNTFLSPLERSWVEKFAEQHFAIARHSSLKAVYVISLFRTLELALGTGQFHRAVLSKFSKDAEGEKDLHKQAAQCEVRVSEKLVACSFQVFAKLLMDERQFEQFTDTEARRASVCQKRPKSGHFLIDLNDMDIDKVAQAISAIGDDTADGLLTEPLTLLVSNGKRVTLTLLNLISWTQSLVIEQFNSSQKWIQLIFDHTRLPNAKLTAEAHSLAEDRNDAIRAKQEAETNAKMEIQKKQQAIMAQFKSMQEIFNNQESLSFDSDNEDETEERDIAEDLQQDLGRRDGIAASVASVECIEETDEQQPTEKDMKAVCVVCTSSTSTKEDPLGMLARYQFSNLHGAPPMNKVARGFDLAYMFRELKRDFGSRNSRYNLASDVIRQLTIEDSSTLDLFDEACVFERRLNSGGSDELDSSPNASSWIDYWMPRLDSVFQSQASTIVWWSCGHYMHRSCCLEHRKRTRESSHSGFRAADIEAALRTIVPRVATVVDVTQFGDNAVADGFQTVDPERLGEDERTAAATLFPMERADAASYELLPIPRRGEEATAPHHGQDDEDEEGIITVFEDWDFSSDSMFSSPSDSSSILPRNRRESRGAGEGQRCPGTNFILTQECYENRAYETEFNPHLSRKNVMEPTCPYCSRRYNCLVVKPQLTTKAPCSSSLTFTPPLGEGKDNYVPFSEHMAYLRTTFQLARASIVLPPVFCAITYRHTLSRFLLGTALALQKSPELIFSPEWADISELGCIISLVAPSIPAQVCFEPPDPGRSQLGQEKSCLHILQTHPMWIASDCLTSIIQLEEQTMRREMRNEMKPIFVEMVQTFMGYYEACAERMKKIKISDPRSERTASMTESVGAFSLSRPFCKARSGFKRKQAITGFDAAKFNLLSCVMYGRTCFSPAGAYETLWPSSFKECNSAMGKSFSYYRARLTWMSRLAYLEVVDASDTEDLHKKLWDVFFLFFILEFSDAIAGFIPYGELSVGSSNDFTALVIEALKQSEKEEKFASMQDPYETINSVFREGAKTALTRALFVKDTVRVAQNKRQDSEPYAEWEDSPGAMKRAALLQMRAVSVLSHRNRCQLPSSRKHPRRNNSIYDDPGMDLPQSGAPLATKRRRLEKRLTEDGMKWRTESIEGSSERSAESLPALEVSHADLSESHMLTRLDLQRFDTAEEDSSHANDHICFQRLQSLESLLRSVRDLADRVRRGSSSSARNKDDRRTRPPMTEQHKLVESVRGISGAARLKRKGSFRSLPDDVIYRYAKFLADQNEGDICRATPSRALRRKLLYLQILSPPADVTVECSEKTPAGLDKVTQLGLYGCLPFLRFVRLFTSLIVQRKGSDSKIFEQCELLERLGKEEIDVAKSLSCEQLIMVVQLLLMGTPLAPIATLFEPNNSDKQVRRQMLTQASHLIKQCWYFRVPKGLQPIKEDGTLMKNTATQLQTDVIVSNRQAEALAFVIEKESYRASHFLQLWKDRQDDEEARNLVWWCANPMSSSYAKTYDAYLGSIYDCNENTSRALRVFGSTLTLTKKDPTNSRLAYIVNIRLFVPFFINLPEKYDLLYHTMLRKLLPKQTVMTATGNPTQTEDITHAPKNNLYVCLFCATYVCADTCCNGEGRTRWGSRSSSLDHPLARHTAGCTARIGMYLHPASTVVFLVVVRTNSAEITAWGSVYRDQFGEEDRYLTRGKPLTLSRPRLKALFRECWSMTTFKLKTNYGWMPLR